MSKPKLVFASKQEAFEVYWHLIGQGMRNMANRMWDTLDDEYAVYVDRGRVEKETPQVLQVYKSWNKR